LTGPRDRAHIGTGGGGRVLLARALCRRPLLLPCCRGLCHSSGVPGAVWSFRRRVQGMQPTPRSPNPQTLNPKPHTPYPKSQTQTPKPQTTRFATGATPDAADPMWRRCGGGGGIHGIRFTVYAATPDVAAMACTTTSTLADGLGCSLVTRVWNEEGMPASLRRSVPVYPWSH